MATRVRVVTYESGKIKSNAHIHFRAGLRLHLALGGPARADHHADKVDRRVVEDLIGHRELDANLCRTERTKGASTQPLGSIVHELKPPGTHHLCA